MNTTLLRQLIAQYQSGYSLQQAFYTHPQVMDAEWEYIFKKHWLFAGTVAQIPKAGDYFLYRLQKNELIVIRGNKGEVYAHYNTCRHRGSAICLQDSGHAAKLICPYHQWVYEKGGSLQNARLMPDDFCKDAYHLQSVQVEVVEGLIFICLGKQIPDVLPIRERMAPFLQPYQISKAKVACIKNYTLAANWKLVAENFRECYHCGGAHPEYCSAVAGANLREDTAALQAQKEKDWQAQGLATHLVTVTPGTTTYAIRYPLRPGIDSYSVDGKKIALPMGTHQSYDAGVVGLVNYPNFWMDAVSDYIWTMRITPTDAATTEVQFCWLVDEKAVEGKDYELNRLTEFWEITGDQDGKLCENNYRGIQSDAYKPGPYAAVEDEVVNFVDWCVKELSAGLD
jgi:phenylpropionate dioxygenase-like ring-hydroxylating dioxygenase large terminal subunit